MNPKTKMHLGLKIYKKYILLIYRMINFIVRKINPLLKKLENPYVMGILTIFIVLYGSIVKPQLPSFIEKIMKYDYVRLFAIFLIAYVSEKSLLVATVVAFTFMVIYGLFSEFQIGEAFENITVTDNLEKELDKLLEELDKGKEEVSVKKEESKKEDKVKQETKAEEPKKEEPKPTEEKPKPEAFLNLVY